MISIPRPCEVCQRDIPKKYGQSWNSYAKRKFCSHACRAVRSKGGSFRKVPLSESQQADIIRRYQEGQSLPNLARAYGCSIGAVSGTLQRFGISRRPPGTRPFGMTPEEKKSRDKANVRRWYSGWTLKLFNQAWEEQQGKCAICAIDLVNGGRSLTSVSADHCHQTGQLRSLLCAACNRGLGCFKDSKALLTKAAEYLGSF